MVHISNVVSIRVAHLCVIVTLREVHVLWAIRRFFEV